MAKAQASITNVTRRPLLLANGDELAAFASTKVAASALTSEPLATYIRKGMLDFVPAPDLSEPKPQEQPASADKPVSVRAKTKG